MTSQLTRISLLLNPWLLVCHVTGSQTGDVITAPLTLREDGNEPGQQGHETTFLVSLSGSESRVSASGSGPPLASASTDERSLVPISDMPLNGGQYDIQFDLAFFKTTSSVNPSKDTYLSATITGQDDDPHNTGRIYGYSRKTPALQLDPNASYSVSAGTFADPVNASSNDLNQFLHPVFLDKYPSAHTFSESQSSPYTPPADQTGIFNQNELVYASRVSSNVSFDADIFLQTTAGDSNHTDDYAKFLLSFPVIPTKSFYSFEFRTNNSEFNAFLVVPNVPLYTGKSLSGDFYDYSLNTSEPNISVVSTSVPNSSVAKTLVYESNYSQPTSSVISRQSSSLDNIRISNSPKDYPNATTTATFTNLTFSLMNANTSTIMNYTCNCINANTSAIINYIVRPINTTTSTFMNYIGNSTNIKTSTIMNYTSIALNTTTSTFVNHTGTHFNFTTSKFVSLTDSSSNTTASKFVSLVDTTINTTRPTHVSLVDTTINTTRPTHVSLVDTTINTTRPTHVSLVDTTINTTRPTHVSLVDTTINTTRPTHVSLVDTTINTTRPTHVSLVDTTINTTRPTHVSLVDTTINTTRPTHVSLVDTTINTTRPTHVSLVDTTINTTRPTHVSLVDTTINTTRPTHVSLVDTTINTTRPTHVSLVDTTINTTRTTHVSLASSLINTAAGSVSHAGSNNTTPLPEFRSHTNSPNIIFTSRMSSSFTTITTHLPQNVAFNTTQQTLLNKENVSLITEDIVECLKNNSKLFLLASYVDIVFNQPALDPGHLSASFLQCQMELRVPVNKVVKAEVSALNASCQHSLNFVNTSCEQQIPLDLSDGLNKSTMMSFTYGDWPPSVLYSQTNLLTVSISSAFGMLYVTRLKLTAVTQASACTQMKMILISPMQGYLESPGWDGGGTQYKPYLDCWIRVVVPSKHVVMISFRYLDIEEDPNCNYDYLTVIAGEQTRKALKKICGKVRPPPFIVNTTNELNFHFLSDIAIHKTGFQLLYSFHHTSSVIRQLPNGQWNCSIPNWQEFRDHFPCNLEADCLGSEDEIDCPYTSERCGLGLLSVDNACHVYVNPGKTTKVSWNTASEDCMRRGARLSSFTTPHEWKSILSYLKGGQWSNVFVGFVHIGSMAPQMYRNAWQWEDGTIAYFANYSSEVALSACGYISLGVGIISQTVMVPKLYLTTDLCDRKLSAHYLCELPTRELASSARIVLPATTGIKPGTLYTTCPDGHLSHAFLACDVQCACWGEGYGSSYSCGTKSSMSLFTCDNELELIPYSLVCNFQTDCMDGSDEDFCVYPLCNNTTPFQCQNKQCLEWYKRCDGQEHCLDASDEMGCMETKDSTQLSDFQVSPPPAVVALDAAGVLVVMAKDDVFLPAQNGSFQCHETHFSCPGVDYYCLPVFVRCNGILDCPGHEDEADCENYRCPGYYRCRGSKICLHFSDLCDGFNHCPQKDDEVFCHVLCPGNCTCSGWAFTCTGTFSTERHSSLHYLDASGGEVTLQQFTNNMLLIHLGLAGCGLSHLEDLALPNLQSLDLSGNLLTTINSEQLMNLRNLRILLLARNPLTTVMFGEVTSTQKVPSIQVLDLSGVHIPQLDLENYRAFPDLQKLNFSGSGIDHIMGNGFQSLQRLQVLDLSGCQVSTFPRDLFAGLDQLHTVSADNYKLCCSVMLPAGFNSLGCRAPSDEISSCDALLRSDTYRSFLAVFAALALVGNAGSFMYRIFWNKVNRNKGFGIFVTHLCASDFLMGVYLAIIGIADRKLQGTYLWNDLLWRKSAICKTAGFLSLLSSEVSTFIIFLITLDRFMVLRFPFSGLRFRKLSAHLACAAAWVLGLILSTVPLLPQTSHWEFYSQTSICIPLPITRKDFSGRKYSFGVMIILNFILCLVIAAGQLFVYYSIRKNSMALIDSTRQAKDLTIARRLITVAVMDFLCWFPIGLLGLLAANGVPIPSEFNVGMAIFALPLNSALNPFLYTINAILERRRRVKVQQWQKYLKSQRHDKCTQINANDIESVFIR